MLTTTVFVDFGEAFDRHLVVTAQDLVDKLSGPDIIFPPFISSFEPVEMISLRNTMYTQQVDFDGLGAAGDERDYQALKSSIMSIVRRQFEPFDINVVEGRARTSQDVLNAAARNAGDPTGEHDSYVFCVGAYAGLSGFSVGQLVGIFGISAASDLFDGTNSRDEAVLVNADQFAGSGLPLDTSLATVISHEAGHSLALRHTDASLTTDIELLAASDVMNQGSFANLDLYNVALFSRFPLMEGDGNADTTITRNAFDQLANDPDIGLRPNSPAYVTGTGAFDRITITRTDAFSAQVSVQAFRDSTFANQIGAYSYSVDTARGILIEAGRSVDRVVLDATLGVPVTIRGGQGADQIQINGLAGMDAAYFPSSAIGTSPGLEGLDNFGRVVPVYSYSGVLVAGPTTVSFTELDDAGSVTFNNFTSLLFYGSEAADKLLVQNVQAGTNEIEGTTGGVGFPNLRYTNVPSVVIDTGVGAAADSVTVGALNATGLRQVTVRTGAGNDTIALNATVAAPTSGAMVFDFGLGADTLSVTGDANWTLTDQTLSNATGGVTTLLGLAGETANLTGGAAANTFVVGGWNGRGSIAGGNGNDTVVAQRDANFMFDGTSLSITGGPSFSLRSIEALSLTGGAGSNTFIDSGWFGTASLNGLGGTDMAAVYRDAHMTLTDVGYFASQNFNTANISFANVELASLTGGAGNNQIDISNRNTPAAINGQGGFDTIVANRDTSFTLNRDSLALATGGYFTLANVEVAHLTGGASANAFTVNSWAGAGYLIGAAGDDTFTLGGGNLNNLPGVWSITAGTGNDRVTLNDALATIAANYFVTPTAVFNGQGIARTIGSVLFDGSLENLRLEATDGSNVVNVTPSLSTTFTIDGNAPSGVSGDALILKYGSTTGRKLTRGPNGSGNWSFTSGHRDVIFESIEQTGEMP